MNNALLDKLKLYHTIYPPPESNVEPFFNVIELTTPFGNLVGFFDSEKDFYCAQDNSCCLVFETREAIHFIKLEDILKFNTKGGFSFSDKKQWESSGKVFIKKNKIGF